MNSDSYCSFINNTWSLIQHPVPTSPRTNNNALYKGIWFCLKLCALSCDYLGSIKQQGPNQSVREDEKYGKQCPQLLRKSVQSTECFPWKPMICFIHRRYFCMEAPLVSLILQNLNYSMCLDFRHVMYKIQEICYFINSLMTK